MLLISVLFICRYRRGGGGSVVVSADVVVVG